MAEAGFSVWLGCRDIGKGEAAAKCLRDVGHDIHVVELDVTDDASVNAAAAV